MPGVVHAIETLSDNCSEILERSAAVPAAATSACNGGAANFHTAQNSLLSPGSALMALFNSD